MKILKPAYFALLLLCCLAAACSPQEQQGELPTLAVLPTLEPTSEQPTAIPATETPLPPTEEPVEEAPLAAQAQITEVPELSQGPGPQLFEGEGVMLPGCEDWQGWDSSRLALRDSLYSQPAVGTDPVEIARGQIEQLRSGIAEMDYAECLAEARTQYLIALDEALLALVAPDRAAADLHEQRAADALAMFDDELLLLTGS